MGTAYNVYLKTNCTANQIFPGMLRPCYLIRSQANIRDLCDQVIDLSEYRAQLYDYLKARMAAIAPNLTVLVCGKMWRVRSVGVLGAWGTTAERGAW